MINNVTLVGRLTKDPNLTYTQSGGNAVCRFTLAVQRNFKNANGEREVDFINCVAWRKTAELIAEYVKKGHKLGITGRIETGSYEKDGTRVYTTDVVAEQIAFLESANNQGQGQYQQQPQYQQASQQQQQPQQPQQQNFIDNLPPF